MHAPMVERLRELEAERRERPRAAQAAEPAAPSGEADDGLQLCGAAQDGDGPVVARLLAAGADPRASVAVRDLGSGEVVQGTALHAAAGHGRLEVARLLLDAGADPSRKDDRGCTPLMAAVREGHAEVLRLLLARGAAADAVDFRDGATAFHYACYDNQADCAEVLARAGCDVGLKDRLDSEGKTGRQLAEREGHTAVVQRLRALAAEQPPGGAVAVVRGLVGAAEHNGQLAAVRRHLPGKARFELELLESGQKISVKPANFELVNVPVGLAVEVHGLVGAAEHNGKQGVVESRVGENGRCGVRLSGRATPLGLKPANLQPANQAVPLEPEPAGAGPAGGRALGRQLCDAARTGDGAAVTRLLAAAAAAGVAAAGAGRGGGRREAG
jgi:hypothetical protein